MYLQVYSLGYRVEGTLGIYVDNKIIKKFNLLEAYTYQYTYVYTYMCILWCNE